SRRGLLLAPIRPPLFLPGLRDDGVARRLRISAAFRAGASARPRVADRWNEHRRLLLGPIGDRIGVVRIDARVRAVSYAIWLA
ncbi:MAG: hypothetical protein J2P48_23565, partial [Alphaproteobacteria bacterium]|nr:hypothetical protein [Alphaproteobacteria bacterium]